VGRRLSERAVRDAAKGRVWTGLQAQRRGLVDELGGLDAACVLAAEHAGLGAAWRARTLTLTLTKARTRALHARPSPSPSREAELYPDPEAPQAHTLHYPGPGAAWRAEGMELRELPAAPSFQEKARSLARTRIRTRTRTLNRTPAFPYPYPYP